MGKQFDVPVEVKFPVYGLKGIKGEQYAKLVAIKQGYSVHLFERDIEEQGAGKDLIRIKNGIEEYLDIKNNLASDTYGRFVYVDFTEKGWLFAPRKKGELIQHVNPIIQEIAEYRRDDMINFLKTKNYPKPLSACKANPRTGKVIMCVKLYQTNTSPYPDAYQAPDFVKWSKVQV